MKRVKLMLLAAIVVASVGGALAFKAKVPGVLYCGTTTNSCPTSYTDVYEFFNTEDPDAYCTISSTSTTTCDPAIIE